MKLVIKMLRLNFNCVSTLLESALSSCEKGALYKNEILLSYYYIIQPTGLSVN